jgi:hypothetical protein
MIVTEAFDEFLAENEVLGENVYPEYTRDFLLLNILD